VATFALDANCMIAAVCAWHEHHTRAVAAINTRIARGERIATPAHALAEAYAVLTRLPPPHRLAPDTAWTLLDATFVTRATVVALSGRAYPSLLRRLAAQATAGGRTYDAIIAECARRARVHALLTFNRAHFDPPPDGIAIVEPD
jgi:predicted nucleic acid-binding protein